jgi:murein DD-endopeptidase MepM/ murein hydrolase activator NlpD
MWMHQNRLHSLPQALVSALCLLIGLAAPLQAQTALEFTQLRDEVDALSRRVGQLQLSIEVLQANNQQLQQNNQTLQQNQLALAKRFEVFSAAIDTQLASLPQRENALRADITKAVQQLVRDLAQDIEQQLKAVVTASAPSTPAAPGGLVLDDNFPTEGLIYKVQPGDTLSTIAQRNASRVIWIQKANKITDPTKLRAGQEIFLPQASD